MNASTDHFARFAQVLSEAEDLRDTTEQLVEYAIEATGATHGGITITRPRHRFRTIASSGELVVAADGAQYELGEGPCVDAATETRSVCSGDVRTDPRWPSWGPAASELGVASVLSAEIHGRGDRIGALNLYSTRPQAFGLEEVELARVLAMQTASVMAAMSREEGLRDALETRTLIGQAQGMVMERFGLDADQAFSVLRRYSQDANVKLRDVAEEMIRTRAVP